MLARAIDETAVAEAAMDNVLLLARAASASTVSVASAESDEDSESALSPKAETTVPTVSVETADMF